MNTEKAINNIIDSAKKHPLYKEMQERKGKFAIHKRAYNPTYLFIGEAPGKEEDKLGIPFVGRSGEILNKWINDARIESYAVINAVPIMPVDKNNSIRKPTNEEIGYFNKEFMQLVEALNPKQIIFLGRSAELAFLGKNEMKLFETKPYMNYNINFIYHPSYYLRNGRDGIDDFRKLMQNVN